jgi:hypothetical protein
MAPITLVMLGAVLLAVFLAVVAAMMWQEAKKRTYDEGAVYVVDDAVEYIESRLEDSRLQRADIKRIIEYEIFYLQGLAQDDRRNPVDVVAGGSDASVDYITHQIAETHGVSYPWDDVRSVLAFEADYLVSIGAVGEPVEDETLGGVDE